MNDTTKITILIIMWILASAYFIHSAFVIGQEWNELQHMLHDKVAPATLTVRDDEPAMPSRKEGADKPSPRITHSGGREVVATWYDYSLEGAPRYSEHTDTAASRTYSRGTWLQVWNDEKIVVVRVNDYGPESWTGKDIDLSSHAFEQLAPLSRGVIKVRVREL